MRNFDFILSRTAIFSCRIEFSLSTYPSIIPRALFANEKEITPKIMIAEQNQYSVGFVADMSPYPTVVIVVIAQ